MNFFLFLRFKDFKLPDDDFRNASGKLFGREILDNLKQEF